MEYDYRKGSGSSRGHMGSTATTPYDGFRPMYRQPYDRPGVSPYGPGPGSSSYYPTVGQPVGPPVNRPPPPVPVSSSSSSGTGIRVAIKPEYRITPPIPGGRIMAEKHLFYRGLPSGCLARHAARLVVSAIGVFLKKYTPKSATDKLGAMLATHWDKPRAYIGCMKSGEVFSNPSHKWYEPESWKFGDGKSYFRHASGEMYVVS